MTDLMMTPAFWLGAGTKLLRVAAIMIGASLAMKFSHVVISRLFIPQSGLKTFYLEEKRARTLTSLLLSIVRYTIYFIVAVLLLQEFQVDTTSIIAGAGVVGLALGVGAQSLIKDFVTGFFIIFEDQYGVGDYIALGDMAGTVEDIGFRATKLRDSNGVLHFIPHGAIVRVSNYTRGHMQAVINIPVAYTADIRQVMELLQQACAAVENELSELVLEAPKVVGIVEFRSNDMLVRISAQTVPLEQGKVEAALRHKVRVLFTQAGVPEPAIKYTKG